MGYKIPAIITSVGTLCGLIGGAAKYGCYPVMARTCNRKMGHGNKRFNHIEKSLTIIENLLLVMATKEQKNQACQNAGLFRSDFKGVNEK